MRLTVHTDRLPAGLNACEVTKVLDYGSVRMSNFDFLLPTNARLRITNDDGSEFENNTVFSGCHEFRVESTLRFDAPADSQQPASDKQVLKPLVLPGRLPFTVVLAHAIGTQEAAAGDKITARLTSPIREQHGKVLVPKGATVTGRIARIERLYGQTSESLVVAIRLETVESGGTIQPFEARLATTIEGLAGWPDRPGHLVVLQDLESFDQKLGLGRDDTAVSLLQFENVTKNYVIHRGLKLEGITFTGRRP